VEKTIQPNYDATQWCTLAGAWTTPTKCSEIASQRNSTRVGSPSPVADRQHGRTGEPAKWKLSDQRSATSGFSRDSSRAAITSHRHRTPSGRAKVTDFRFAITRPAPDNDCMQLGKPAGTAAITLPVASRPIRRRAAKPPTSINLLTICRKLNR